MPARTVSRRKRWCAPSRRREGALASRLPPSPIRPPPPPRRPGPSGVSPGLSAPPRAPGEPEPAHHAIHRTLTGVRGAPHDIAAAVRFLTGPGARYITGQTIRVNGGAHLG